MLHYRHIIAFILVGSSFLASCQQEGESIACKPVETITPQSTCYNSTQGLTLVGSGHIGLPSNSQFTWSIFPQNDTTLTSDISASREKVLVGSETIVVPDSILKNYPKFIVKVKTAGCGMSELHSIHYSFVKRQTSGSVCTVWQRQDI
ncbi:hypothetical protein [Larkinella rosea]|uniref:Lipoprotein n=1 Tax=Larkinella rosea TaxID=2025312 RepID=A0A3P1BEM6_9BACT|nr:hypothetical protein [Larkinella rosea]RRA99500.1 hypothetical protein EHT25_26320 [Larkinella rosea]